MVDEKVNTSMRTFLIVWIGQVVSLSGSELSSFAIGIWVYQQTGIVTQYALIFLFTVLPRVLITPYSGVVADRFNRRWVMILSDTGAGISTLLIAVALFTGNLENNLGIIYVAISLKSIFSAFQLPAYTAAVTQLVPKEKLSQASGMMQLGRGIALLLAPVLGASLLATIELEGVIIVDVVTFLFALATLLFVAFPDIVKEKEQESWWREALEGWTALSSRPGLLALGLFFVIANLLVGVVQVLATPLILAFTTETMLGISLSIAATGMLVGGILMGVLKEPKRLVYGVIGPLFLNGLWLIVAGFRPWLPLITVGAFLFFCGLPLINGYSQVILQRKVKEDVQGRVFATINILAESALPVAYLAAGPLADWVEPLMLPGAPLAESIGPFIGVGAGRGIGFLFILIGIIIMVIASLSYAYPRLRLLEEEIPDAV